MKNSLFLIFVALYILIYSCSYDSADELVKLDTKTQLDSILIIDTIRTDSSIVIDTTMRIDTVPIIDCDTISFSDNVFPLIELNCIISPCHDGSDGTLKLTSFTRLSAYSDAIISSIKHENGAIPMPRNPETQQTAPKLSDEEIAVFECWVKNGKPNN